VVAALASARRLGDEDREQRAVASALAQPFAVGESPLVSDVLSRLQYHDVDPASLLTLYRTHDRLMRAELEQRGEGAPFASNGSPRSSNADRRVRVGYLSADFRRHVMSEILEPVLAAHDRTRFSIRLYSLAPAENEDDVTARLRLLCDDFVGL